MPYCSDTDTASTCGGRQRRLNWYEPTVTQDEGVAFLVTIVFIFFIFFRFHYCARWGTEPYVARHSTSDFPFFFYFPTISFLPIQLW